MSASVESIVGAHLDTWNSAPGRERERSIAAVYTADVFIGEPAFASTGHAGMEQAIAGLQGQLPGTVLTRSGPIQIAQDLVTYGWNLGPAGGETVASGRDVLIIRDDAISSLYVLIDAPA